MLIQAVELERLAATQHVVILDCRFTLGKPTEGREKYAAGHIPDARYFDLEQDLSGPASHHGGRHPLPDVERLAAKFGSAGIDERTFVIVYDGGEGMAARAWWLLRFLGHDKVSLLDGGLPAWQRSGFPLSTDTPTPNARAFLARPRMDWVVDVRTVEDVVASRRQARLIDSRARDRYLGLNEPIDPVAGHIPDAINCPWTDGVRTDGTWKSPEEQRDRFTGDGVDTATEVIVYCGSGVTACANLFALELAGIPGGKLYAGSWSDWVSYPEHAGLTK